MAAAPSNSGSTVSNAPAVNLNVATPAPAAPAVTAQAPVVTQPATTAPASTPAPLTTAQMQAELDNAKQTLLGMQTQAANLNQNNSTNTSSVVSSSAPAVQDEKNASATTAALAGGATSPGTPLTTLSALIPGATPPATGTGTTTTGPDTSSATSASDQYMQGLQTYLQQLQASDAAQIDSINQDYATQETNLSNTQKSETGSTTAMLARSGGYLGGSASGTGVLLTLAQSHAAELADLESKKNAAIQAAQAADQKGESDIVNQMNQQAITLEQTINDRKQQFFTDTQNAIQAQQSAQAAQSSQIKDQLTALSNISDPSTVPQATKDAIDQFYGVPGFTDQYLAATTGAAAAKTAADEVTNNKNLISLLQSIPQGKQVTMPDGTTYTGMGSASDVTTFMQVDNSGVGHLITYNKQTGATSVQSVGQVGKTSSTVDPSVASNYTATILQGGAGSDGTKIQGLTQSKLSDGTYDPSVYLQWRQAMTQADPAYVATMDKQFLATDSKGASQFFNDASINYLEQHGVYLNSNPAGSAATGYDATGVAPDTSTVPDATDNSISVGQ
jgi:hypothetical protein